MSKRVAKRGIKITQQELDNLSRTQATVAQNVDLKAFGKKLYWKFEKDLEKLTDDEKEICKKLYSFAITTGLGGTTLAAILDGIQDKNITLEYPRTDANDVIIENIYESAKVWNKVKIVATSNKQGTQSSGAKKPQPAVPSPAGGSNRQPGSSKSTSGAQAPSGSRSTSSNGSGSKPGNTAPASQEGTTGSSSNKPQGAAASNGSESAEPQNTESAATDDNEQPDPDNGATTSNQNESGSESESGESPASTDKGIMKRIGEFFSGTPTIQGFFDLLGGLGNAIGTAFSDGVNLTSISKRTEALREIVDEINKDNNISEDEKQRRLQIVARGALSDLGIDDSEGTVSNYLFDTLRIPAQMITSTLSNAGDFLTEVFTPKQRYSVYTPLSDQAAARYIKPVRDAATDILDARQKRYGIQNLQKFGLTEPQAAKLHDILTDPTTRSMIQSGGPAVLNTLMGAEYGTPLWETLSKNGAAIISGFQGDGTTIFNQLDQEAFSERSLYALGEAANRLTATPSAENGYARADDYAATIRSMQANGWNAEAYVVRATEKSSRDIMNAYRRFSKPTQTNLRKEFIATQRAKALDQAIQEISDEELEEVKAKTTDPEAKKKIGQVVYKEDGSLDVEAFLGGDTTLIDKVNKEADAKAERAGEAFDDATEGKGVSNEFAQELPSLITGERIAEQVRERTKNELNVAFTVSQMRGAKELFGGRDIGVAEARQLIRAIGSSNLNGNDTENARQTSIFFQTLDEHGVDTKTAMSFASAVGEEARKVGIAPDMTQAAIQLAGDIFGSRMDAAKANGEELDPNVAMASARRDATTLMRTKDYADLAWLYNAPIDPESTLGRIQQKLKSGEPLDAEDMAKLRNPDLRKEAFSGDVDAMQDYTRSVPSRIAEMSADDRRMLSRQTYAQQQRSKAAQLEGRKEVWQRGVSKATLDLLKGKDNKAIYSSKEDLWKDNMILAKTFGLDRAKKILSGQESLSEEDIERLQQANPELKDGQIQELVSRVDQVGNLDLTEAQRTQIASDIGTGNRELAKAVRLDVSTLDEAVRNIDLSSASRRSVMDQIQSEFRPDTGKTIAEDVLGPGDEASTFGTMAGRLVTRFFGGPGMDPKQVQADFERNGVGFQALIGKALNKAKGKDEFYKLAFGIKLGTKQGTAKFDELKGKFEEQKTQLLEKLTAENPDLAARVEKRLEKIKTDNPDEFYKSLSELYEDTSEEGAQVRKIVGMAQNETELGQAVIKRIGATTKQEAQEAQHEVNEAMQAGGFSSEEIAGMTKRAESRQGLSTPEEIVEEENPEEVGETAEGEEEDEEAVPVEADSEDVAPGSPPSESAAQTGSASGPAAGGDSQPAPHTSASRSDAAGHQAAPPREGTPSHKDFVENQKSQGGSWLSNTGGAIASRLGYATMSMLLPFAKTFTSLFSIGSSIKKWFSGESQEEGAEPTEEPESTAEGSQQTAAAIPAQQNKQDTGGGQRSLYSKSTGTTQGPVLVQIEPEQAQKFLVATQGGRRVHAS